MSCLIQAAEIWVPDAPAHVLAFGAGWYQHVPAFGAVSQAMCFGRDEGLPGRAWERARPLLLNDLKEGYFRRTAAAAQAGLGSAVAVPFFNDDRLVAVMVLFFSASAQEEGAIELWRNDSRVSADMTLEDGHYGAGAQALLSDAKEAFLPRGFGLPGLAWQRESAVFLEGLASSPKFLRAEAAGLAGVQHGLALPCAALGYQHYVLALFGTARAPIAQRIESWVAEGTGELRLSSTHVGTAMAAPVGLLEEHIHSALQRVQASGVPQIVLSPVYQGGLLALPVWSGPEVSEVVALYL